MRYRDKLEEFKGGKNKIGDFISGFNRAYCKEKVILDEMSLFGIFPLDFSSMVMVSMKVYGFFRVIWNIFLKSMNGCGIIIFLN